MTDRYNEDPKTADDFTKFYRNLPDDELFFADLIRREWELEGPSEYDSKPTIYPQILPDGSEVTTRDNSHGSIYVYPLAIQFPQRTGIGYGSSKRTGGVSIDIQIPGYRKRSRMWGREVARILEKYRCAGRNKLNSWDYLEYSITPRDQNYTNYFQTVIDVKLYRTVDEYENTGRGV